MAKFLSVTFNYRGREEPIELEATFNRAKDWVKYAPNCWLLYTNTSEKVWFKRIREVVHSDDNVFVVELNITSRAGWLPRSVWDWINKTR